MTDKERFEKCFSKGERRYIAEKRRFIKEQDALREHFYYGNFGDKIMRFYLEMAGGKPSAKQR